jgi:hypothetical protein
MKSKMFQPVGGHMSVTDRDKLSLRAFQIWEAAGRPAGRDVEHWLQAEMELSLLPPPGKTKSAAAKKVTAGKAVVAKATKTTPKTVAPKRSKTTAKV